MVLRIAPVRKSLGTPVAGRIHQVYSRSIEWRDCTGTSADIRIKLLGAAADPNQLFSSWGLRNFLGELVTVNMCCVRDVSTQLVQEHAPTGSVYVVTVATALQKDVLGNYSVLPVVHIFDLTAYGCEGATLRESLHVYAPVGATLRTLLCPDEPFAAIQIPAPQGDRMLLDRSRHTTDSTESGGLSPATVLRAINAAKGSRQRKSRQRKSRLAPIEGRLCH